MMPTIQLNDLQTAFRYKSNKELKKTYYIFKLLQYPILVKSLTICTNLILNLKLPFKWLIKNTVFKVFCAGETEQEAFNTILYLHQFNVKSVLDYVSEGEKTELVFNNNTQKIIKNINANIMGTKTDLISIKLTGLENADWLTKINYNYLHLNSEDLIRFNKFKNRIDTICKNAAIKNVIIYIDAEETWMQDIIDFVAEELMVKYNQQKAIIYNTLQMYRTDRIEFLNKLISKAKTNNFIAGIKLVRGAYMEKEGLRAIANGINNPIFLTKKETDNSFNNAAEICISNHEFVSTCIATHNQESVAIALECINKYQVKNATEKVQFSQLLGMSDHLTFNLAANGMHASKYLPYGEVEKAIPYLMRRAEENSSINGQINKEVILLKKEIYRRKQNA